MDWLIILIALVIAISLVGLFFMPAIRIGLNIADEGYLYLGSLLLRNNNVPIRDFRAYDPGRYYWCAIWMKLFGESLPAVRTAMALVMAASLTLFSWLVFTGVKHWGVTVIAACISFVWSRPYYKGFEVFFSLLAVFIAFLLLASPSPSTYFLAGFSVGLSLFFGLNMAFYLGGSAGIVFVLSLFVADSDISLSGIISTVGLGMVLGLLPVLYMSIRIPGYFDAYREQKILAVLKRGTPNLFIPLPWIWVKDVPVRKGFSALRQIFFKLIFTLLPVAYLASLLWALYNYHVYPESFSLIIGAAIVGLVHLHHVFSRADAGHLLQSAQPFIILFTCQVSLWLPVSYTFSLLFVFLLLSIWAIVPQFDSWFQYRRDAKGFVCFKTSRERLLLPRAQACMLESVRKFVEKHSNPADPVFFAPLMPSFYPLFDRKPALYDTFCVYPASQKKQIEMVSCLEDQQVQVAVIFQVSLDGRKELRFSETHPLIWQYLHEKFDRICRKEFFTDIFLFRRKPGKGK